jgi:hypothetical protein
MRRLLSEAEARGPLKEPSDAELDALIDAHSPPGSKPSAEWTAEELQDQIEILEGELKARGGKDS